MLQLSTPLTSPCAASPHYGSVDTTSLPFSSTNQTPEFSNGHNTSSVSRAQEHVLIPPAPLPIDTQESSDPYGMRASAHALARHKHSGQMCQDGGSTRAATDWAPTQLNTQPILPQLHSVSAWSPGAGQGTEDCGVAAAEGLVVPPEQGHSASETFSHGAHALSAGASTSQANTSNTMSSIPVGVTLGKWGA